jgi:hypothetical protein
MINHSSARDSRTRNPIRTRLQAQDFDRQAPIEISFEPSAEIHRSIIERHADIAEVAGAVARRG